MHARRFSLLSLILAATALQAASVTVDFSDLTFPEGQTHNDGAALAGSFISGGFRFDNEFTDWGGGYTSWSGFAYAKQTDNTTAGFGNQYGPFPGTDGSGIAGGTYAVAYGSDYGDSVVHFPAGQVGAPLSLKVANNTYAGVSMRDGDLFSKKFGGTSGLESDYFQLIIWGRNAAGAVTGQIKVMLADFTSSDSAKDYLLDTWKTVDLSPLGSDVSSLTFSLNSSDYGSFGLNTPSYFLIDDLTVDLRPEIIPGAEKLENGWKRSSWFGYYNDADAPWVYSQTLGWIYWVAAEQGAWIYGSAGGWYWTGPGHYPALHRQSDGATLYVYTGSSAPALWIYDFSAEAWSTRTGL